MSDQQSLKWPWSLPRAVRRGFVNAKAKKNMPKRVCRQLLAAIRAHGTCHQAWVASKGVSTGGKIRQRVSTDTESFVGILQTWKWVTAPWLQLQLKRGA
jgi:hypothetical protein